MQDYKHLFNLEDRFDHFLSSMDTKIRCISKDARWVEVLLLMGTLNAYLLTCEIKVMKKYGGTEGRRKYKADVADQPHLNITYIPSKHFVGSCRFPSYIIIATCHFFDFRNPFLYYAITCLVEYYE